MRHVTALVLGLLVGCSGSALAGGPQYQIIVNSARTIHDIDREDLAAYFLKRELNWPDGVDVSPVDLTMVSDVRRAFTEDVLANSVNAILAFWEQQITSGLKRPPPVKGSETDVITFVRANPGAIGYVSRRIQLPPGVAAVPVVAREKQASAAAR